MVETASGPQRREGTIDFTNVEIAIVESQNKVEVVEREIAIVEIQNKVEIDEREDGVFAHLKSDLRGRWPRLFWVQCWRLVWAGFGGPAVGTEGATKH